EKNRAYKQQMKLAAKIRGLYISADDKHRILSLMDRKSTLIATVKTAKDKERILGLTGNAKRKNRKDVKSAKRELSEVDRKIRVLCDRAQDDSYDTGSSMGRVVAGIVLVTLIVLGVLAFTVWREPMTELIRGLFGKA
ncbi:MAG: hypothetical protein MJ082_00445, partial [Clostridia bacterium]|nr:hypothetical protein [Clostridia bacterium]